MKWWKEQSLALKRSKRITTKGKTLESEGQKQTKRSKNSTPKPTWKKTLREARRQWQPNKNKERDQKNTRESLRKEHEKNRKEHQTRAPEISPKTNTKNQEAPGATWGLYKSKGKPFDSLSVGFALGLTQHFWCTASQENFVDSRGAPPSHPSQAFLERDVPHG